MDTIPKHFATVTCLLIEDQVEKSIFRGLVHRGYNVLSDKEKMKLTAQWTSRVCYADYEKFCLGHESVLPGTIEALTPADRLRLLFMIVEGNMDKRDEFRAIIIDQTRQNLAKIKDFLQVPKRPSESVISVLLQQMEYFMQSDTPPSEITVFAACKWNILKPFVAELTLVTDEPVQPAAVEGIISTTVSHTKRIKCNKAIIKAALDSAYSLRRVDLEAIMAHPRDFCENNLLDEIAGCYQDQRLMVIEIL